MDMKGNLVIAVDFDETLSLGAKWPEIGEPNEILFEHLKKKKASGARLILWTCRNGQDLDAAVEWCRNYGLEFDTVNENLPELIEAYGGDTRKVNADIYIDDKAISQSTIINFAVAVLAEVAECAKQEDAPIYQGDREVDQYVRLSDVEEAINKNINF